MTSAGVVRLGLGFVASLAIARALGAADYGVYAVLAATVSIAGVLAEGGLTEAAVLRIAAVWPKEVAAAEARARGFFWLRLVLSAAVVAVSCVAATVIAERALSGVDAGLLRWALVGIVATAASGALSAILQATGAFGRMSSLTLINTGLTAVLAVALALAGRLDLLAALVILGIGTSVVTFVAAWAMLPRGWRLSIPRTGVLGREAASLLHVGRWLWVASLFAMLTANAEVLMLNRSAALTLVGAYALALNLATKADVVNHSLYTVLLPGVAHLDQRGRLRSYVRRGLLRSVAIAVGMALLIPLAEPFIRLAYGAEFSQAEAAVFLRWLIGVMIFDVLLTPLLLLPLAFRRARLLAAADAVRAVTLVLVGLVLIPVYGPYGAIAARFASRVAGAVLVLALLASGGRSLQVEDKEAATVAQ